MALELRLFQPPPASVPLLVLPLPAPFFVSRWSLMNPVFDFSAVGSARDVLSRTEP